MQSREAISQKEQEDDEGILSIQSAHTPSGHNSRQSVQVTQRNRSTLAMAVGFMLVCILLFLLLFHQQKVPSKSSNMTTGFAQQNQKIEIARGIPKIIWVYSDSQEANSSLESASSLNQRYYAHKSGFEIRKLSQENFAVYLPAEKASQLEQRLNIFWGAAKKTVKAEAESQIKLVFSRLRAFMRQVIALHILDENGGLMVQQSWLFAQDLSWMDEIDANPYVNRLDRNWPTHVFGFFDPKISEKRERHYTDEPAHEPFKLLRHLPALHPGLIAARKSATFISQLCSLLGRQMTQSNELIVKMQQKDYQYEQGRVIGELSKRVLQQHQDKRTKIDPMVVDKLGLSFINMYYGAFKLTHQLTQYNQTVRFRFYTELPKQQLTQLLGLFRYCVFLGNDNSFAQKQLEKVVKGEQRIMKGSLLHSLFPGVQSIKTYENPEVSLFNQSAPQWKTLPKIVWVIWIGKFDSASAIHKIGYSLMKKRLKNQGWTINMVTLDNLADYLKNETILELFSIANNKQFQRHYTTLPDLIRLALLVEHGGIYMDVSCFLMDGLNWLINLARLPSHLITNRLTELPKVVLSYSFYINNPPFWEIHPRINSKHSEVQLYENYFIAAEKGSEFIIEVYEKFKEMLMSPWSKVSAFIEESGMGYYRRINEDDRYLMQMQMMLCVLGLKHQQLALKSPNSTINAAQYYGFWSLNGLYGHTKFWGNHLDDILDEPGCYYLEMPSDLVDGLIGRWMFPIFKTVNHQNQGLNQRFEELSLENHVVSDLIHPRSHLGKMMKENGLLVKKENGTIVLVQS